MLYSPMIPIPAEPVWWWAAGLIIIALAVLILPFKVKWCEHNLEIFFLIVGIVAVTVSRQWSISLIIEALKAPVMIGSLPIGIFQIVLIFGFLIYFFYKPFYRAIQKIVDKLSMKAFIFIIVFFLGIISSVISVIVTSVILAEIIAALPLVRQERVKLVVVVCFAVGLGAVLTPLGEPMSTILVQRLSGAPYNADFIWPIKHFALYVIPACAVLGIFGAFWIGRKSAVSTNGAPVPPDVPSAGGTLDIEEHAETWKTVVIRSVKIFAFVAALVLLGEGLKPLVTWFLMKVPSAGLFWINTISAILDNATLTAIEVNGQMTISQITAVVLGLLIAGGMLIPGNIPNIVAAGRLKISMKEWAKYGLPIGLALMIIFFVILLLTGHLT